MSPLPAPTDPLGTVLASLRLEPRLTARDRIVDLLRTAILNGQLASGQRLPEAEVAHQLNVSRMPIREAFGILESEGLLRRIPNRGAVVADVSFEDVVEVFRLRALLEGMAAEQAAERLPDRQLAALKEMVDLLRSKDQAADYGGINAIHREIHSLIWQHSGRALASLCQILFQSFPKALVQVRPQRTEESATEYMALIEALSQRNGPLANRLMYRHIEESGRLLVEHLRGLPPSTLSSRQSTS